MQTPTSSEFSASAPTEPPDATLELTVLSIDGYFSHSFVAKRKPPSISAWVDPAHKRSTTSRNSVLHLPLSPPHLQNPDSVLTVQIVSPRLAFKHFLPTSSASVPLSSLRLSADPITIHLRRPSGRVVASVRFLVRILWSLNPNPLFDYSSSFVAETGLSFELNAPPLPEPNAPPLPEPETRPSEILHDGSAEWKNFLLGALSGAAAVILVNVMRQR